MTESRREKVSRIKREVQEGTYEVDPALVVEGMLQHGERIEAERFGKDQSTIARERREKVVQLWEQRPRPTMAAIGLDFGVSAATICADLKAVKEAA